MTCKDCVHYNVCGYHIDEETFMTTEECSHFKNKIDFVEIPCRCKDCKLYEPYNKPVEDFDGYCIARDCETDEMDYCNYGQRKED